MNKNQVNGAVKDIAGKVQEEVGKLVDSNEQQAKGLGIQLSGKTEKAYGDAIEAVKNATRAGGVKGSRAFRTMWQAASALTDVGGAQGQQ